MVSSGKLLFSLISSYHWFNRTTVGTTIATCKSFSCFCSFSIIAKARMVLPAPVTTLIVPFLSLNQASTASFCQGYRVILLSIFHFAGRSLTSFFTSASVFSWALTFFNQNFFVSRLWQSNSSLGVKVHLFRLFFFFLSVNVLTSLYF